MSLAVLRSSNGDQEILDAELILPIARTPTYYVTVDGDESPGGAVEILFASGVRFAGVVARAVAFEGRVFAVIAGGGGGLSGEPEVRATLEAAGYTGTPFVADASLLVGDILTASNERLSDESEALIESKNLPRWHRVAGLASHAMSAVARALRLSWRVRADGQVWLGEETFDDYADEENVIVQRDDSDACELHCALRDDRPDIQPGVTVLGRRVVGVTYILTKSGLRARLRYESTAGGMTLAESLSAALGPMADIYAGAHIARVVQRNSDDTVDLLPANDAVGATTGIGSVPFRCGISGARQRLAVGTEVILRFGSSALFPCGDPSLPYCEAAGQDADADRNVGRKGDLVPIGTLTLTPFATTVPQYPAGLVISFQPSGSPFGYNPPPIVIQALATIVSGISPLVPYAIEGYIATGSPEVFLRKLPTETIP